MKLSLTTEFSHQDVILALIEKGYMRREIVSIHGDFAVRGSVIDVFGPGHHFPLRIEYDGHGIDRIATFDVTTQRTLGLLPRVVIPDMADNMVPVTFHAMAEHASQLLSDWKIGDYLVHETFGIGQYKGLVYLESSRNEGRSVFLPNGIERAQALSNKKNMRGQQQKEPSIGAEYLWLQYKGDDKLYIPLQQLQLISKYGSVDSKPQVNSLYDGSWQKTKAKARRSIDTLVEALLELYKTRQTQRGIAYPDDSVWQLDFEQAFVYTPTQGQLAAIHEIKQDMQQPYPMERLLCGDVGYGKSEVLLRAVFKAAEAGKQVAILVPTTLLARQHFQLICTRMAPFPFRIAMMSRFVPVSQQKETLRALKQHKIDILVGTHRLVQKDVVFADLGLIVVDEEQRFGVKDKESLKNTWPMADVLTVSATPIPRTLYMAITGAKAMSSIVDPPVNRKPVLTAITPRTDKTIRWGIAQELARQGQVFYVYNRITGLSTRMNAIKKWFPKARVAMVHGQVPAKQLDAVMTAFAAHEIDILVCTSIVENGLDIPNANTILIDDAPKMGLAQIYQLRGRVGRSTTQGYAYLLYDKDQIGEEGQKRLEALTQFVALGSGYHLAMRDLEMRGAGTMLGYQQHGTMTAVGFDLYASMIQETLQPSQQNKRDWPTDIPLFIPESYIPDERLRLGIYHRLLGAEFSYQIEALLEDCRDRFGRPPESFVTVCQARMACL
jgi:transcription-repair coupling factor (superfamily II helicase)